MQGAGSGPFRQIQQALDEAKGLYTQCEHAERKSMRVCEVVEALYRRRIDVCCPQETRYRGGHCRIIKGTRYRLFWSGINKVTEAVGVFVTEEWIEVFEVQRVSTRIILLKLIPGQCVVTFLPVYAPKCGLSEADMDLFYDQLRAVIAKIPASEFLTPCCDWNGHVGSTGTGALGMADWILTPRVRES